MAIVWRETIMTCLVTGATGNIGSRVVERLIERGERPRIFVRDADKARARFGARVDLVLGDLADASALAAALREIDALFLVNSGPDLACRDQAAAAASTRAGVKRVVKLSAMGARSPNSTAALGAWHAQGEAAIRASGVAWTFVQPAGFMSNALGWAASIKAEGVVRAATGDGKIAMIHPDDIAAVATKAMTSNEYEGQALPITGPEALSYGEMTAKIGDAIGKPLEFQPLSDEHARQRVLADGMPPALADALVGLWRSVREGRVAMVTDTVERVVGRKPIAFDQWALHNRAAFL
jgi:uncharacterized protein YbjT (DUF2867 family)